MISSNKPYILFEINGILVEYERDYTKLNTHLTLRNGLIHLLRLKKNFRVGVYTTMSTIFAHNCALYIENMIGHNFKFDIVLCARHCLPCPKQVRRHWLHMYKPIHKYFDINNTILVDLKTSWSESVLKKNIIGLDTFMDYKREDMYLSVLIDIIINNTTQISDISRNIEHINDLLASLSDTYTIHINKWLRQNSY